MVSKMSKSESEWRAEADANTLAEYQEIMNDKARMSRAIKVAKRKAEDLTKRANAMNSVAKTRSSRKK
jgi:hypothetical protein